VSTLRSGMFRVESVDLNINVKPRVEPAPRNPYAAPSSAVGDTVPHMGSAMAILLGAAIGNGIAYAVLSVCGVVFLWVLTAQGVPAQELYVRAYQSNSYLLFAHVVGLVCLLPGGYWGARAVRAIPRRSSSWSAC
jgi:hypothetical protein